jgi:hypothetical protein
MLAARRNADAATRNLDAGSAHCCTPATVASHLILTKQFRAWADDMARRVA